MLLYCFILLFHLHLYSARDWSEDCVPSLFDFCKITCFLLFKLRVDSVYYAAGPLIDNKQLIINNYDNKYWGCFWSGGCFILQALATLLATWARVPGFDQNSFVDLSPSESMSFITEVPWNFFFYRRPHEKQYRPNRAFVINYCGQPLIR